MAQISEVPSPANDDEEHRHSIDPDDKLLAELLDRVYEGDRHAKIELITLFYGDLKARAQTLLRVDFRNQTLDRTDLVHQAYTRIMRMAPRWETKQHFLNAAALAMRHLLIDRARGQQALKNGGEGNRRSRLATDGEGCGESGGASHAYMAWGDSCSGPRRPRIMIDDVADRPDLSYTLDMGCGALLDLDESLGRLEVHDFQAFRAITLRFFLGRTFPQIADILGVSTKTVERCIKYSVSWLKKSIEDQHNEPLVGRLR